MQVKINSPQELGLLIRATRKSQKVRLDDVAGSAGLGHVFVREVERGKETVQLGRVMKLLAELGIELQVDVAQDVAPVLAALKAAGVKPIKPRRRSPTVGDAGQPGAQNNPSPPTGEE